MIGEENAVIHSVMNWNAYWNRKVQKCTILDLKMAQGWAICCTLLLVKLFPQVLCLSPWWFAIPAAVCFLRLFYTFWIRPDPGPMPPEP